MATTSTIPTTLPVAHYRGFPSVSSSSQQYLLALNILHEHFGPVVREVAGYVLRRGQCTSTEIRRYLESDDGNSKSTAQNNKFVIKRHQIKEALVILLQHNLLTVVMPTLEEMQRTQPRLPLSYSIDLNAITLRLRFPKFLLRARQLYGEAGQAVLEEILLHGRLPIARLRKNVEVKLQARQKQLQQLQQLQQQQDQGGGDDNGVGGADGTAPTSNIDISPTELKALIQKMVAGRYIIRVTPFDLLTPSPPLDLATSTAAGARAARNASLKAAAAAAGDGSGAPPVAKKRGRPAKVKEEEEEQDDDEVPVELAMLLPPPEEEGQQMNGKKAAAATSTSTTNGKRRKRISLEGEEDEEEEEEKEKEEAGKKKKGGAAAAAAAGDKRKGKKIIIDEDEDDSEADSSPPAAAGSKKKTNTATTASSTTTTKKKTHQPSRLEDIVEEDQDDTDLLTEAQLKQQQETLTAFQADATDTLWTIGIEQFHRDLRHLTCVKFVRQKVNTTAESLVRVILSKSLPKEYGSVDCERSHPIHIKELEKHVTLPANVTAKMYMDVLKHDQVRIVGHEGLNQEVYCVYLSNIIDNLQQRTLHSIIRERYSTVDVSKATTDGDRNARICRVLLDKKYLDQQQLSELAMMSLRETRERLYHMYRDELVTFQEVPRRADHHPNQTFYLWTFKRAQVVGELVDRMYKGALNLRLRRQKETEEKRDLLANKDNIRDEVEAAHFDQLTLALDRLDQALENLDETLMLFTVF